MSSLEQEMFLQWGNKKRMRRLRAANKDKHISRRESNSSAPQETFLFHSSRFSRGSQGAILRSGGLAEKEKEKEKEERYYTTRGVVDTIGKACLLDGEDSNSKGEESNMWPKLFVTLSSKEKEEDFMAMKGCKPSHRPKKRPKLIQKSLLLVSPGTWLADMCPDRYDVRVKKSSKKRRARGLKAMGNVESDSD
ncbi:hypothetical protein Rs2_46019 [Raphanus sativus]|uniref:Uncharacterized protein LOC108862194 n=1 Tax=Raphanus sativus TaxID=3726 RepID=A0A6J0P3W3_RAPSA|nr:uncharacterized protein LOC108862194 [Raphanus sativus]KAJ4872314.1 hypothetical protein Rs2_46019 [Raphanus sativus]